jgi:CRISPR system Cascade subunit CasE
MYLSQLKLPKLVETVGLISRFNENKYTEHQVLWDFLGDSPDEKRTFLYRIDKKPEGIEILLLSEKVPTRFPRPWHVITKPFEPNFQKGQRLGFRMRMASTYDKPVAGQRGQRMDLVMSCYADRGGAITQSEAAQIAAERWLNSRAESAGFRLTEVTASGYTRHVLRKRGHPFTVPMMDLDGQLEVVDPEKFIQNLGSGFGKEKFAGCGMMLVRKV